MKILLIILSICLVSCSKSKKEVEAPAPKLKISLSKEFKALNSSDILNLEQIIPLETLPKSLIGNIDRVSVNDTLLYIMDRTITNSIYIFSKTGSFLKRISKKGRGPHEYQNLEDIYYDKYNNKLLALDRSGKKILVFSALGEFLSVIKLDDLFSQLYVLNEKEIILYSDYYSLSGYNFSIVDKTGKSLSRFQRIPRKPKKGNSRGIFSNNANKCLYTLNRDNNIYSISNGIPKSLYSLDFDGLFISEKSGVSDDKMEVLLEKDFSHNDIINTAQDLLVINNILYFNVIYQHDKRSVFIDLKNNKQIYSGVLKTDLNNLFLGDGPIGQTTNEFIFALEPSKEIERYKRLKENPEYSSYASKYSSLFENKNIDENSNPVLLLFSLNKNEE